MVKKVTVWSAIGSIWTAFWLFIVVRVTIPDYPWGTPIWKALYWDEAGYFHELEAILLFWGIGIVALMVISFWWHAVKFLDAMSKVIIVPDGQPVKIVVRKRVERAPNGNLQDKQAPVPHSASFVESDDTSRLRQWYGPH